MTRRLRQIGVLLVLLLAVYRLQVVKANCVLCATVTWTPICSGDGSFAVTTLLPAGSGDMDSLQTWVAQADNGQTGTNFHPVNPIILSQFAEHGTWGDTYVYSAITGLGAGAWEFGFTNVKTGVYVLDTSSGWGGVTAGRPPVTALSFSGSALGSGVYGPGMVTLSARNQASGSSDPCLSAANNPIQTYYHLNGSAWQPYSTAFALGKGVWTVDYYSSNLGGAEPWHTATFAISVSATPTPTSTSTPTATPHPTATPGTTFNGQVAANVGPPGVNTGVVVAAGDLLTIHASGIWSNGNEYTGGPDGWPFGQSPDVGYPLPTNSLIGHIGSGPWFEVGSTYSGSATTSGILYLAMNDNPNIYGDNSGALSVTISLSVPLTGQVSLSGTLGQGGWYVSPVTYTVQATSSAGLSSLQAQLDGGPFGSVLSQTVSGQGSHTVAWTAVDRAGTTASGSQGFKIDTLAPVLTVSLPPPNGANGWYTRAPVALMANASDSGSGLSSLTQMLDGVSASGGAVSVVGDGIHTVSWLATDNAGNTRSASATIKIDSVPPTGQFTLPPPNGANGWYTSNVPFILNGSDATSGVASLSYSVDSATFVPGSGATLTTSGIHGLAWQIADKAGNVGTAASPTSVKIDLVGPQVAFACTSTNHATCSLTATAVSGIAQLTYSLDGAPARPYTGPLTLRGGGHKLAWSATSSSGQTLQGSQSFVTDTSPPWFNVTSCPQGPFYPGSQIPFTGAAGDDFTGVASWTVSISGPTSSSHSGGGPGVWANIYNAQVGTYTFSVALSDGAGNDASFSNVCQITISSAPVAVQPSVDFPSTTATRVGYAPYVILYTPTNTFTPSPTRTRTPTATATSTATSSPTPPATSSYTATVSSTPTATDAPTQPATEAPTQTDAPTEVPTLRARRTLTAFVYEDTNGNGRCDAGEPGLSGEKFMLYRDDVPLGQVISDGQGLIQVDDVGGSLRLRYLGTRQITGQMALDESNQSTVCTLGIPVAGLAPLQPDSTAFAGLLGLSSWLMMLPGWMLTRRRTKPRTACALQGLAQARLERIASQTISSADSGSQEKGDRS